MGGGTAQRCRRLRNGMGENMTGELKIRNMSRDEVDLLVDWAAREGWNPGRHDAEVFWATDPEAFIAAELDGQVVGGGAITSYGGEYGFMGFFIVRPEFRGHGLGNVLWHVRRERLRGRLRPDASIGLDGVFAMQDYYAKGGFVFSHRDIRYRMDVPAGLGSGSNGGGEVRPLEAFPFAEVSAYDRTCFPAPRPAFLKGWIAQADALALGLMRAGRLAGYGVIRRCGEGCKIGPLFADDVEGARVIFDGLAPFAAGGPVFLDVPENNPDALRIPRELGMLEVFGCARMYLGPAPDIATHRIFGVTTFELG